MKTPLDIIGQMENCRWTADAHRALHELNVEDLRALIAAVERANAEAHMTNVLKLVLFAAEQYRDLGLHAETQRRMDEALKPHVEFTVVEKNLKI